MGHGILQGTHTVDMNQNFANSEREIKVAVIAGEQVTISVGSWALLVEKLCTTIWNFLHIKQQKHIQLYSVPAKKKWNISGITTKENIMFL